jgi:hypothetical protein
MVYIYSTIYINHNLVGIPLYLLTSYCYVILTSVRNKAMSSSKPQQQSAQRVGEALWSKMPKVNAELFTLTYGAMVMQLIKDHEEVDAVNAQLGEENLI